MILLLSAELTHASRSKDVHTSTAPLLIDGPNSFLAGRERPDGNDETALEGTEEDSSFPAGFWHPYGRGNDALPPSRVVCFSPEAVVQVTLQFPTVEALASAQVQ